MITIFTPTYDRGHLLPRLYDSLCQQTNHDFEWLIIDDGSTDDTECQVDAFYTEAFPVRYLKKENGGKHTAYNLALQEARGEYFLCVDSDDWLASSAIEQLSGALEPTFGLCAYKTTMKGRYLGTVFPDDRRCVTSFDLYARLNCSGEYTFVYPTHIARQVPFPVFAGERFITESVIYDRLDRCCPVKLFPEVITICEYQADGYSANTNKLMRENPAGFCLYYMQRIDLVSGLLQRILAAGKYQCFGRMAKSQRSTYRGKYRMFVASCAPIGAVFQIYYHLFRGF